MKQLLFATGIGAFAWAISGCGLDLSALLPTRTNRVELVNNSNYPVVVKLYYGDDQDTIEAILTEEGTLYEVTVGAGETSSFERRCDDLQAIIIDDADLQVVGSVGPEDNTNVLRDGDDFFCGDRLIFTFDHSDAILDFNVQFRSEPQTNDNAS